MRRALLLCLYGITSALSAQQPPLAGTWELSFPGGMRVENGQATPLMTTGALTVVAMGDSLIGTLVTNPAPDLPARPPARLAGQVSNEAETVLVSRSEARQLHGFSMGNAGPQPVTGVRAKG